MQSDAIDTLQRPSEPSQAVPHYLLLLSVRLLPLHHSLVHSSSAGDHPLDIFHAVSLERAHQFLLLRLRQAIVPRIAVEFPELLHVLVGHGLRLEGSLRWVGAAGFEESGGGGCCGADVSCEGLSVLILLGVEILLLLVLLVGTGGVGILGPVVVVDDEIGKVVPLVW
jgi:hypothetical protein